MAKTKTRRESDHEPKTEPDREPKTEPLLMNEKKAARVLGFKVRTLQTWRHRGGGPPFIRVSSRCIRYRREDLLAWIEELCRAPDYAELAGRPPGKPLTGQAVSPTRPLDSSA